VTRPWRLRFVVVVVVHYRCDSCTATSDTGASSCRLSTLSAVCRHSCQSTTLRRNTRNRIVLALALFVCHQILFCSAETKCSAQAVKTRNCICGRYGRCGCVFARTRLQGNSNCCGTEWLHVALEYLGAVGFAETRFDRLFYRFDGLLSDDETDPSFGIEEVVTCLLKTTGSRPGQVQAGAADIGSRLEPSV
jgi:hypothetical protein